MESLANRATVGRGVVEAPRWKVTKPVQPTSQTMAKPIWKRLSTRRPRIKSALPKAVPRT
jgi:hypothetical protein